MKNWITNNFWIKVGSLILAIITWFYVNGELSKERIIPSKFYKSSYMEHLKRQPTLEKKQMNRGYIVEKK